MKQTNKRQVIAVIGGGMIGLSAAVGLRQQGHHVYLIERGAAPQFGDEPELRVSALAHHSRALLNQLGVWQQLPAERLGPYTGMQVWDTDSFGAIEFHAAEVAVDDLGAIVENKVLEHVLWQHALAVGVQLLAGEEVIQHQRQQEQMVLTLASQRQMTVDYVIAADGAASPTREREKLPLTFWSYEQSGIVAVLRTELPHQGVARQVFLPTGPVAWLPLGDPHLVGLVWSADQPAAEQLLALPDTAFMHQLQASSDQCLGRLELVSARAAFPLKMQYTQRWVSERLLVIGDAAHAIHPLAGQGANLGFGDVIDLLQVFEQGVSPRSLRAWERQRKAAAVTMIAAMEGFKRGFSGSHPALKLIRGLGLKAGHHIRPLKRFLIQTALGH